MNAPIKGVDIVSLFCRININTKRNLLVHSSENGVADLHQPVR